MRMDFDCLSLLNAECLIWSRKGQAKRKSALNMQAENACPIILYFLDVVRE